MLPGCQLSRVELFLTILLLTQLLPGDSSIAAEKPERIWPVNVPLGGQVGDTMDLPLIIPNVPFSDSGSTTSFNNDYDFACPYTTSVAPDVVYRYYPLEDQVLTIDLCGSAYDTKVYVVDQDFNLLGCNDDFYHGSPCGSYVSLLEQVWVTAGAPVFVMVDGYAEGHGEYQIEITECFPCTIQQPIWGVPEYEPPLEDGYVDMFNSGCETPTSHGWTDWWLTFGATYSGLWGTSGFFTTNETLVHDTDWIVFQDSALYFSWTIEIVTEFPIRVMQINPENCDDWQYIQSVDVYACQPETLLVTELDWGYPVSAYFRVAPIGWPLPNSYGEFNYTLNVLEYAEPIPAPVPPEADYSLGCPTLPAGETVWATNNLTGFTNQFDPSYNQSTCPATSGADMVWEAFLEEGDHMYGRIRHDWLPKDAGSGQDEDYPYPVFVVDDCRLGTAACVEVSSHITGWTGFSFYAPETGFYYLVWDGQGSSGVGPHMHVVIESQAEPPTPPDHDDCSGARPLEPGSFQFEDSLTAARNRFDPGRNGCAGVGGTGRDVVYKLNLAAGQSLDVTMTGTGDWDEEIYLIDDCLDPMNTCVAAGVPDGLGGQNLAYTALTPKSLFLVCDSYGNGPRDFSLAGFISDQVAPVPDLPGTLVLGPCQPNPFNPRTELSFALPHPGRARLRIFDVRGRMVRTLLDGEMAAGWHQLEWDGRDAQFRELPSGVYFSRLEVGSEVVQGRMTLLR